jgi:hypothetical protein
MITVKELNEKHPWIRRRNNDYSCDPYSMFGVDCGDGWLDLLDELMTKIEEIRPEGVEIHQIKEKFGGLRFYIGAATDEIWQLIDKYENKSFHICERCGAPGERRDTGWIKTLCDKCDEQDKRDLYARR